MEGNKRRDRQNDLTEYLIDEFNLEIYQRLGKQGGTALNRQEQRRLSIREQVHRSYHPSPAHLPELGLNELFKPATSFFTLLYNLYGFIKTTDLDLSQIQDRLKRIEKDFFQQTEIRFVGDGSEIDR